MSNALWNFVIGLDEREAGDYSLGEFRQTKNTGLIKAYDFEKDQHLIASFDMPDGLKDRKDITSFIKENAENLIRSSKDIMDDLKDGSTAAINDAFESFAEKIGAGKMEETKILSGGPDLGTTMHINAQTGAVLSEKVMEHDSALKKGLGKFGAVGGVLAAGVAFSTGANAAEVTAQVIPGGQSVMAAAEGNQLEAKLLLAEETGIGSIVTELARPALRGLGVDVQSGILEDIFNSATGRDTQLTVSEISHKQSAILQKAGFPEEIGGKPINEYLKDPAQFKSAQEHMEKLDNNLGLQALDKFQALEKQMPTINEGATQVANILSQAMDPAQMVRTAISTFTR